MVVKANSSSGSILFGFFIFTADLNSGNSGYAQTNTRHMHVLRQMGCSGIAVFGVRGDREGELALVPILQILKSAGYKGWMVVEGEQDPAKANPLQYADMARKFLREHWG